MSYATGTIVGARDNSPGRQLQEMVRDHLLTHSNWTHVETFHETTQNYRYVVMRNSGVGSFGSPWFIAIGAHATSTSDSVVDFHLFEGYDAVNRGTGGTGKVYHQAPCAVENGGARTQIASGAWNDSWNDLQRVGSTDTRSSNGHYTNVWASAVNGTYDYWFKATKHGVMVMTRVGTTVYAIYLGAFETFIPNPTVNDPFPLVSLPIWRSNNPGSGAHTRVPLVIPAGRVIPGYWGNCQNPNDEAYTRWSYPTRYTHTAAPDAYQNGAPLASRIALMPYSVNYADGPRLYGAVRGLAHDMLMLGAGSGATTGDTVVISGRTYVYLTYNTWFDTAAT